MAADAAIIKMTWMKFTLPLMKNISISKCMPIMALQMRIYTLAHLRFNALLIKAIRNDRPIVNPESK